MYQALIVAAGAGTRSGLLHNKNLHPIKDKPMILYSLERFLEDEDCEGVVVVCSEDDYGLFNEILKDNAVLVLGGDSRQKSVMNGLAEINARYVLIHDGARPNLKLDVIKRIKDGLTKHDAVTPVVKAKDALAVIYEDYLNESINRENVMYIQTPQAFVTEKIKKAHQLAQANNHVYLDDATLFQNEIKEKVSVVLGDSNNIKATTADDFVLLEALL
ncbi:MAG: 2-C-methyl-D-erythritol 4-phosphate cytidylyltransferase [Candidatus Izemoplasmatales bacterium]|jgi:2-C-methyl-D-erythritol 4-phosphate cytidylyltransferase|nr:2-C-methyl-D-erythritol 4-phosphate cytidylyltransferase [Candidatus Izemoplasmatales bacterium]